MRHMDNIDETKTDCLHFNGYKPCLPHKQDGLHCRDCKSYQPSGIRILIIKLQASGEVIRNTPLLVRLEKEFPDAKIFWLTLYPELLPKQEIYKVLKFGADSSLILKDIEFDLLLSLDKDLEACALANQIRSKVKKGFSQRDGVIIPFDSDAKRKWLTGIFDDLMKENTKHYVEEIFEICGFQYDGEPYILPEYKIQKWIWTLQNGSSLSIWESVHSGNPDSTLRKSGRILPAF